MELTAAQHEHIASCLPVPRGHVQVSNLQVLNAFLHVAAQGCQRRGLPARCGPWHTVYRRLHRWARNGVRDRVCTHLQRERILHLDLQVVGMDSTIVPVHPDGTGAPKKRTAGHWARPGRLIPPNSSGCRG